ncbi:MAG: UDP-N-acetylmuramoyl-L-alanine--D-glutamate ligase, partial [Vicinamibacterales bacterium]
MTSHDRFTVRGKRVIVVGAARSGVAAAELLVRRGASVTLTDVRPQIADEARLRSAGVTLELGEHRESTLRGADL